MEVLRRGSGRRNGVVAGSVWESRMKVDEVSGGIKVFNGLENSEEGRNGEFSASRGLKRTEGGVSVSGRRKTWRTESFEGICTNPIRMRRERSEADGVSDESCEELSESDDGIGENPIQMRMTSSEATEACGESREELSVAVDGIEKTPIQKGKPRSRWNRFSVESLKNLEVAVDGTEMRETSSEAHEACGDQSCEVRNVSVDEVEESPIQKRKTRLKWNRCSYDSFNDFEVSVDGTEKTPIQSGKTCSEEHDVFEELARELARVSVDENEKIPIRIRKPRSKWNRFSIDSLKDLEVSIEGAERTIQMKNSSSEAREVCAEPCEELSVCVDETVKSPIQSREARSNSNRFYDQSSKEFEACLDGNERNTVQKRNEGSEEHVFSESVDEIEKNPIQVRKDRSKWNRFSDEPFKDLEVSENGTERNPIQVLKKSSDLNGFSDETMKDPGVSPDGMERKSTQALKKSSESNGPSEETLKDLGVSVDRIETKPIQIRRARSELKKNSDSERTRIHRRKTRWTRFSDETCEDIEMPLEGYERKLIQIKRTDDGCKEFGDCKEKRMLSSLTNVGQISSPRKVVQNENGDNGEDKKKGSFEMEVEKKSFDVKEINITEQKPKQVVLEEKKVHTHEKPVPISSNVQKQPPPVIDHPVANPSLTEPSPVAVAVEEEHKKIQAIQDRLQSTVDLVMWRDIPKTAFVFGLGSFILLFSSFIEDFNLSLISAISYMGLLYLSAMSLYRSIICSGDTDIDESNHINLVGEEEAIRLLKLILPWFNEVLLKLRGILSGDPTTTMKLAILMFVLARCGSSITIWKMAKLGFFGVFTVPRLCSPYCTQLIFKGKHCVGRVGDAWETCLQKEAVGATIFTLVWSLCSMGARVWAVPVLIVAVRYYQQPPLIKEDWEKDDVAVEDRVEGR